ncbi:S1C family serine protease [Aetokthonos hydrillicola Thurmond2011]|jgi:S1-C subfamily serine protease|uniref:S1C family serine protease n=1 Tax=Aetokthonos hydrillicola Thurmond2011 TaxID=2712845 RepID=A0AAP5IB99_9CYAN|nr:trypsin-like peptidase domain-containing protein [Aetokthonos hydrillicola]MBO3462530.1 PDZ domain-containing protein [Aetokthonos hydrillicola CCALA 1050]MBW4589832.1 S1C family serine protease [Aetokthonos hydrillicola CCALA 1050]MDR9898402.1 S1C family serine protease [Aetokthonos hydrillicola Thurmond2011]
MSSLLDLSNNLADTVEQAGSSVVAVNGGRRFSPSGIHWRDGIIVTSVESLHRQEEITVTLSGGRNVPVTLIGYDSSTDVAVFRLQGVELPVAKIGDATTLKVGHLVLGLARSSEGDIRVSMGAVSVVGDAWRSMSGGNIDQFIRPDITLYPGFAGGALVDAAGYVVGMNTSGRRGTALTIPAATVNRVLNQLLAKGHIARGYLGLGMQPVRLPNNLKTALNLTSAGGVIVVNVEPNAPAENAGVLLGDVLVKFDGTLLNDTADVLALLNSSDRVGKTVPLQIVRGGTLVELTITIGERPVNEK